jgi:hypothetical protein
MNLFNRINNEVESFFVKNKTVINNANVENINIKAFEMRDELIKQLEVCAKSIPLLLGKISAELDRAKATHSAEMTTLKEFIAKNKKAREARTGNPTAEYKSYAGAASQPAVQPRAPQPKLEAKYTKVKLTEALSLSAVNVPSFDAVKQDGDLYYVEPANHFAIKICGALLHGNIGTIYTDEKNPTKIKDCKFTRSCVKKDKCDYYHDPMKFDASKDYRNFIASSFLYSPPNLQFKSHFLSRKFGSRDNLDVDMSNLADEDVEKFYDQTMHELLCSLLLYTVRSKA